MRAPCSVHRDAVLFSHAGMSVHVIPMSKLRGVSEDGSYEDLNELLALRPGRESNLGRQSETGTEHPLCRRNVSDFMNGHLARPIDMARLEHHANLAVYPVADIVEGDVIVRLEREAVDMDDWQLRVRAGFEEHLLPLVQPLEVVEELNG